jgi:chromosome segregation and condensation protein ScpB
VKGANDLSISQLSDLTGRDRRRIAKQLKDLQYTAGERGAMLNESAEALPLVYAKDNLRPVGLGLSLNDQFQWANNLDCRCVSRL